MTSLAKKTVCLVAMSVLLTAVSGCMPIIRASIKFARPALENIEVSLFQQNNLDLVKKGLPGQILLLEGMLETLPNDLFMLTMSAKTYAGLGMMVEDEDPAQATMLYARGRECGLRALKLHSGFRKALADGKNMGEAARQVKDKKYVPVLMWTAAAMGSNVLLNAGDPMIVVDMATVNTMVDQVITLQDDYFYGLAHMFVGTVNSMLPASFGGDKVKAKQAFEKVFKMTDNKFLLPRVFFARFYVTDDEDAKMMLRSVIDAPEDLMPEIALLNQVAKSKARHYLAKKEGR